MKKISENIIIKKHANLLDLIQTGTDYTYIESFSQADEGDAYACVDATKFAAIFEEDKSILSFKDDYLEVKTGRSKGLLPYMKEYGIFSAEKELEFEGENIIDSFDTDYSSIDLDLTDATDQFSYILFNRNFVCRYLYNTLSFYDELPMTWYNITPKQFKLLKSLGKCNISVSDKMLLATSQEAPVMLRLRLYESVINLAIIKRFFEAVPSVSFTLNNIDFKKLKTFLKEYDSFTFKRLEDSVQLSTLSYSEEFNAENFTSDAGVNLLVFKKDLENLQGNLAVYCQSGINYIISHPDVNKTVLFTCDR